MTTQDEYLAVLRCQTWNVWPEKCGIEVEPIFIDYGSKEPLSARCFVISYVQRTAPEQYIAEKTKIGPLIWDGEIFGLYKIRNMVLKAPEDTIGIKLQYRNVQRGEVDLLINFKFTGEIPSSLVEGLRATAYSILSLLNLKLNDCLIPSAPFQIKQVLSGDSGQLETGLLVAVHGRQALTPEKLKLTLTAITNALVGSKYGAKLRTALEIYAAHITEQQVRVRFLLLVIAIESLATPTKKHNVAIDLLNHWKQELEGEIEKYEEVSEELESLESLKRELNFRSEDSLRSQIRKLFSNLSGLTSEDSNELKKRSMHVYDKRSVLVHDGRLPDEELVDLEIEARELLEKLLLEAIAESMEH